MKKITLFILLSICIVWTSCDDDTAMTHELDGEWHLVSIVCLCPIVDLDLGESVWTFDVAAGNINVVNSVPTESYMLAPGDHPITVDDAANTMTELFGITCSYSLSNGGQTLNFGCNEVVDGPYYTLIRSN